MKKLFIIAALALAVVACAPKQTGDWRKAYEEFNNQLMVVYQDSTLTDDQKTDKFNEMIMETMKSHINDTLGLQLFSMALAQDMGSRDELKSIYDKAPEFIRENEQIKHYISFWETEGNTEPGKQYIDIAGPNALTSEEQSISAILAQGKPLIVDIWASWCSPCRREIKGFLLPLAEEYKGKLNILGIAVWEKGVEDTVKAIEELGITWPVIYDGKKEGGTTDLYCVKGVPTMIGIAPDGTIVAKGHSGEEVFEALRPYIQ